MKTMAITTLAALFLGAMKCLAQSPAAPAAPPAAKDKVKKEKKKPSERMVALMKKIIAVQKTIKDKESAQAACPKFAKLKEKVEKLGDPLQEEMQTDPEAGMAFMMLIMPVAAEVTAGFEELEKKDFYGCEELKEMLLESKTEISIKVENPPQEPAAENE